MPSFIRHPKDFWSGIIFLVIGLCAVYIGQDYPMGSAGRMGPAYFPTILGGLLGLIGLAALIRSFISQGDAIEKFAIKNLAIVLGAVLLYGVLIRGAGLIVATITIVVIGSLASSKTTWTSILLLAVGSAAFCVLIFVKLLGLPIPVIGPWFGM